MNDSISVEAHRCCRHLARALVRDGNHFGPNALSVHGIVVDTMEVLCNQLIDRKNSNFFSRQRGFDLAPKRTDKRFIWAVAATTCC
jgi:hypothetical protein